MLSKWKTIKNNHMELHGASFRVVWDREGGSDICYVVPTEDQGNKNARLIAAAPELLESCKMALALLEIYYVKNTDGSALPITRLENIINYVEKEEANA